MLLQNVYRIDQSKNYFLMNLKCFKSNAEQCWNIWIFIFRKIHKKLIFKDWI